MIYLINSHFTDNIKAGEFGVGKDDQWAEGRNHQRQTKWCCPGQARKWWNNVSYCRCCRWFNMVVILLACCSRPALGITLSFTGEPARDKGMPSAVSPAPGSPLVPIMVVWPHSRPCPGRTVTKRGMVTVAPTVAYWMFLGKRRDQDLTVGEIKSLPLFYFLKWYFQISGIHILAFVLSKQRLEESI